MKDIIEKVKKGVHNHFIKKYVDEPYWQIIDDFEASNVVTILKEELFEDMLDLQPNIDLVAEKAKNTSSFQFEMHKYTRYLFQINDCIVEPDYNWVILSDKKLFKFSWPYIQDPWLSSKPKPSVWGYRMQKEKIVVDEAILAKYYWSNYYHFFFDILTQLNMYDAYGIPENVPVIVPHDFEKYKYATLFLTAFQFKRKIIIQKKGEYIAVKKLFVAKDRYIPQSLLKLREEITSATVVASANTVSPEKLFLTRGKNNRRAITNIDEIEEIALQNGFTIKETGELTVIEQIKLMQHAKYIVAIHGASLGNLLFCRGSDVRLFEILPGENFMPYLYKYVCIRLGYKYNSILGSGASKENGSFQLDKQRFEQNLTRWLEQ